MGCRAAWWLGLLACTACGGSRVPAATDANANADADEHDSGGPSDAARVDARSPDAPDGFAGPTYIKASNTGSGDGFGQAVALSADGNTLAVGAPFEQSDAAGIDGNQSNATLAQAGAVYIYARASGGTWTQQAYVKAAHSAVGQRFGTALALSSDGDTLAVGALGDASCAVGVDGDDTDHGCAGAGAAYVFVRSADSWAQQAYVKASNTGAQAGAVKQFGRTLALAGDGNTLAVGGPGDCSASTGIGGNASDTTAPQSGAVYVFARAGSGWSQSSYIKASNTDAYDRFGEGLALSADGGVLAVGAPGEASAAAGIGGSQQDNSARDAGAVYLFARGGATWTQTTYVKPMNPDAQDEFGETVALSSNGSTLGVAAIGEASSGGGVDNLPFDNGAENSGALYAFANTGGTWTQQAYLKEIMPMSDDELGLGLALSADGNLLFAGAPNATGTGTLNTFVRTGATWMYPSFVTAANAGAGDAFGVTVASSAAGNVLAVGAYLEDSAATGIGGDESNNACADSGAVYVLP